MIDYTLVTPTLLVITLVLFIVSMSYLLTLWAYYYVTDKPALNHRYPGFSSALSLGDHTLQVNCWCLFAIVFSLCWVIGVPILIILLLLYITRYLLRHRGSDA